MIDVLQRQPLISALALAAAVLVVAIGLETGFGSRLQPRVPEGYSRSAAAQEARLLPPLARLEPERDYPEMVARPLFIATRRPAPAAEAASQVTFKRDQYVLQGVTIAGATRIALLKEKASGRIVRVEKGHEVNGVTLSEVNPESVTLALGKDQEVIPLQVQKAVPGGVAPPQGPFGPLQGGIPGLTQPSGIARPAGLPMPGAPPGPTSSVVPLPANPGFSASPQTASVQLTPEELLARRRARRSQTNE
jgi:hypothetical protein